MFYIVNNKNATQGLVFCQKKMLYAMLTEVMVPKRRAFLHPVTGTLCTLNADCSFNTYKRLLALFILKVFFLLWCYSSMQLEEKSKIQGGSAGIDYECNKIKCPPLNCICFLP